MTALTWIMLANAALWLGLGLALAFLAVEQNKLAKRLQRLERDHEPR